MVSIPSAVSEKIEFEKINSAPSSGETESGRGPVSRMQGGVVEYYNVWKFRDPAPPHSDVIRLCRNLKMPPYGNARTRSLAIYTRPIVKNTNDRVEKKLLHTAYTLLTAALGYLSAAALRLATQSIL